MILVDTSVWIGHLRRNDVTLARLLETSRVVAHPYIVGEIALGHLSQRGLVLQLLADLPQANVASHAEVLDLVEREALFGRGIGYVDVHLLASARLTPDARLWTRDARLSEIATMLRVGVAEDYRGEAP